MSRWNLAWLLGIGVATLVGLSLSQSAPTADGQLGKKHDNLRLLVDVLDEVQHKYVKDLEPDKMRELVENMVNSGLERLDPHSSFINAEEYKQFQKQSRGRFGGIGIRIGLDRSGQILVESPMVGTPAYEAGILAGDIILKVDGKSTESQALKKVIDMITGEPGEKVTLTVLHEGQKKPVDIDIVRAEIQIDSVLGDTPVRDPNHKWEYMIDPTSKIAYIRLVAFTETTVAELIKVVDDLKVQGMKGLVLDLRNNPGGLLRAAVEVSSMFLPEGKRVVSTKGRNQKEEVYDSRARGFTPDVNTLVCILLNRYSASASEIVAAALQDHLRAIIIGERSYGKGSVQNIILLENGNSALKLTTASYWRPSGRNIHRFPDSKDTDEWGVRPNKDFEVKLTDEERIEYYKYRRERDIVRKPGQAPKTEKEEKKEKKEYHDKVLDRAVEYLREQLQKKQQGAAPAEVPFGSREARLPRLELPLFRPVSRQSLQTAARRLVYRAVC